MARRQNFDYFVTFVEMTDFSCRAAEIVCNTLHDFKKEELLQKLEQVHNIEHAADERKHELMETLAREFLPPIEIEDIAELAQLLDDVTDAVEDVLVKLYAYNIDYIKPEATEFADIIFRCCQTLKKLMEQFVRFKKSETLYGYIVEINRLEGDGDELFTKAMHDLHVNYESTIEVLTWSRMLDCLERCCDAMEDVADAVENIVMKNT